MNGMISHAHAHRGSLEGRTKGNVPVYNVAMPLLLAEDPGARPFKVIEVPSATATLA